MSIAHLTIVLAMTLGLGLLAIPLYIRAAKARNIIDVPNERSSHSVPTPRGGGIFIPIGIVATCIIMLAAVEFHSSALALTIALSLVGIIGFIDDVKSLPSTLRLAAHLACGIAVAWSALPQLDPVFAVLAFGLSTIWLVGCLNIFNFMDGIDGIATCQGIVAASIWFVISHHSENELGSLLAFAALGGLVAFLIFNWPPAKVFMGDSSSGTLGLLFGAFPLIQASGDWQDVWIHINYGALALFPFLFDGSYTLFRRAHRILFSERRSAKPKTPSNSHQSSVISNLARLRELTEAHRSHLYQRWNQSGKSHRFVTTAYALWAMLCGAGCLLSYFAFLPLWTSWILACLPAVGLALHSRTFPSKS